MKMKWLGGFLMGLLICTGSAIAAPGILAADNAGNYTPATFTNQSNAGIGFGAWDLWNEPATLGDSTAGGGGDLNSTNGYSFRFMGDGAGGWCNGKRNLDGDLVTDDVLSFIFTYNWDGGGRGVDIFCATGQFANVIDVSGGNSFKVNGTEISTEWSPGAVVSVDITQLTNGITVHLIRTTNGVENLNYTTNILNPEPASGFSLYCGGYTCDPADNVNYAIFMNDIQVVGEPRNSLNFTDGTWNPALTGPYEYTLVREGAVTDDIVVSSSDTGVLTVPAAATFATGSNTLVITATVVSVSSGPATIIASNVATGAWAEYIVTPEGPTLTFTDGTWNPSATGPYEYTLTRNATVGDDIVVSSSDTGVLTVPPASSFSTGVDTLVITATVVSVSSGPATIVASNVATGAWAEYVVTPEGPTLNFTAGTWDPAATGPYEYTLERMNGVGDDIVVSSTDINVLTVPPSSTFPTGVDTLVITATVVSVNSGNATIIASNVATGAWAEYNVYPVSSAPAIGPVYYDVGTGEMSFSVPATYTLVSVEGADNALVGDGFVWSTLVENTDYTLNIPGDIVTMLTGVTPRRVIRIRVTPTL